ncbi:anaerobic selenocysteine-containing dehydrogenase [Halopolyspora algeriensis]|uniref:Anaerobic selenocysteine-containing dehydrogenase n=1 Tax=Halopolyspora algeriensis TaxID=1500506 RepID=A0A368VVS1_9ACTN|nr:nitrate reductase [Halopolyspora algeriensis]RCW45939.1 anaerobic selenocysteine-containing dehydrogenase [Halopolyspora algeriensis]TQM55352.1 anaerobic selenocysteine-containing dehydrogenase [Halopolyspora algeriensis]
MIDRIAEVWGTRTPYEQDQRWPVRVDQKLAEGVGDDDVDRWVQSACVLCSNGCGCDIAVKDGRMVGVRGRATDIVNHGRLGPKGLFGSWQGVDNKDRLTRPLVRENGRLVATDWDTAMQRVVDNSRRLLQEKGPLSHGFYTSGQLFLEEYYTLSVVGKAGIRTPHMDGNTRLCTATAAASMKESFGSDGQPGSYVDIDECDAIFLYGHNMAETQTVLWMRVLDRLAGQNPPKVVCVDPRETEVARHADVHLPVRNGTNQALMNGLVREVIVNGWMDEDYVAAHTLHFDELRDVVEPWTPERVAEVCGVDADDVRRTAEIFGTTERVLSTVLQGFYQSHQATAASCNVNNLHLLRGLLGRPGCGILQMNGQPTAQNTRETGADGDLPGFRNWGNTDHVAELARVWNVDPLDIPSWAPPTHAMQIFRYAEQGSINFLWVQATNPAVSLPELARIRELLHREELFLVVQDLYLTETAQLADVVLPAAAWGEKTGTFTNVNRTVHLSDKAVEPPGEARSDLDIFLDYAHRMDFRDRDGNPLVPWSDPEGAFHAWRECTRGRPCDYTGLSYERFRGGSGIPWPCNDEHPDGTVRLYEDGVFPTDPDYCETYGHDLVTGAVVGEQAYRAMNPAGRALLKAAPYQPPHEEPDEDYPLRYTSGRTVYHWHTRTKTGRAEPLDRAAPQAWVELAEEDAERLGVIEGDIVRVASRRGEIVVAARIGRGRQGVVFAPFHYGYWDTDGVGPGEHPRSANELTITEWDPVSKQPVYKVAAVRVDKVATGDGPAPAPTTAASRPARPGTVRPTVGGSEAMADERIAPVEPPAVATREEHP